MTAGTIVDVVMPQMGVSVSEGTVTRWLKNVGDPVAADESLLEISTDKVDTEVPSPGSGILQAIFVQEGETVPVGTLVGRIGPGDAAATSPQAPALDAPALEPLPLSTQEPAYEDIGAVYEPADVDEDADLEDDLDEELEPAAPAAPASSAAPPAAAEPSAGNGSGMRHTFVSPVVARIAAEHGIDPSSVPGTGREGRVTKKDILAFVESGAAASASSPAETQLPPAPPVAEIAAPQAAAPPPPIAQPPAAPPAAQLPPRRPPAAPARRLPSSAPRRRASSSSR